MVTLVVGTPQSGKSELAERVALERAGDRKKYYIATMVVADEDGETRVKKHRRMREGKGFFTLEWPLDLEHRITEIQDAKTSLFLLECVSNLVGNIMYAPENRNCSEAELAEIVIRSVKKLAGVSGELIVVTNEFPLEDASYDDDTRRYVRLIAHTNNELRKLSDTVYEHREGNWRITHCD